MSFIGVAFADNVNGGANKVWLAVWSWRASFTLRHNQILIIGAIYRIWLHVCVRAWGCEGVCARVYIFFNDSVAKWICPKWLDKSKGSFVYPFRIFYLINIILLLLVIRGVRLASPKVMSEINQKPAPRMYVALCVPLVSMEHWQGYTSEIEKFIHSYWDHH